MDQPQRANAAQMAARAIKSIKSKHPRRPGGVVQKDPPNVSQWMPPASDGGLFGGNIQASGTFDFAAPTALKLNQQPTFGGNLHSSSGGSENQNVRPEENDRFYGDDRKLKRAFGQSAGPVLKTPFQQPNIFSSSTNFGSTCSQSTSNVIESSTNDRPQQNIFGVQGATSTAPAFSFGSTSQFPASSNSVDKSMPALSSTDNESNNGNSIFNFNIQEPNQTTRAPMFQFNVAKAQAAPAASPFVFGLNTAPNQPLNSVFGTSSSTSAFGSTNTLFPEQIKHSGVIQAGFPMTTSTTEITGNIFGSIQNPNTSNTKESLSHTNASTATITGSTLIAQSSASPWTNVSQTISDGPSPFKNSENLFGDRQKNEAPAKNHLGLGQETTKHESIQNKDSSQAPANIFRLASGNISSTNPFANLNTVASFPANLGDAANTAPSSLNFFSGASPTKSFPMYNTTAPANDNVNSASIENSEEMKNGNSNSKISFEKTSSSSAFIGSSHNLFENPNKSASFLESVPQTAQKLEFSSSKILSNNYSNQHDVVKIDRENAGYPCEDNLSGTINPFEKMDTSEDQAIIQTKSNGATPKISEEASLSISMSTSPTNTKSSCVNQTTLHNKQADISPSVSSPKSTIERHGFNLEQPNSKSELIQHVTAAKTTNKEETSAEEFSKNIMESAYKNTSAVCQITEEYMAQFVPAGYNEIQRKQFYVAFRIRAMNKSMAKMFAELPLTSDPVQALLFYTKERQSILESCPAPGIDAKRKASPTEFDDRNNSKRRKQNESSNSPHQSESSIAKISQRSTKRKFTEEEDEIADDNEESQNLNKRSKNFSSTPSLSKFGGFLSSKQDSASSDLPLSLPDSSNLFGHDSAKENLKTSTQDSPKTSKQASTGLNQLKEQTSPLKEEALSSNQISNLVSSPFKESDTANKFRSILEGNPTSPLINSSNSALDHQSNKINPFSRLELPASGNPSGNITASSKSTASGSTFSRNVTSDEESNIFISTTGNLGPTNTPLSPSKKTADKTPFSQDENIKFRAEFDSQAKGVETPQVEKERVLEMGSDPDVNNSVVNSKQATSTPEKCSEVEDENSHIPLVGHDTSEILGYNPKDDSRFASSPPLSSSAPTQHNTLNGISSKETVTLEKGSNEAETNRIKAAMESDLTYTTGQERSKNSNTPDEKVGPRNATSKTTPFSSSADTSLVASPTSTATGASRSIFGQVDQPETPRSSKEMFAANISRASVFNSVSISNANENLASLDEEGGAQSACSRNPFLKPPSLLVDSQNKPLFSDQTWKPDSPIRFGVPASTEASDNNTSSKTPINGITSQRIFGALQTSESNKIPLLNAHMTNINSQPSSNKSLPALSVFETNKKQTQLSSPTSLLASNPSEKKDEQQLPASSEKSLFSGSFGNYGSVNRTVSSTNSIFGQPDEPSSFMSQVSSSQSGLPKNEGITYNKPVSIDDQDEKKHEQINLTAVGPGEEDEEVIHEVRVKAFKFIRKDENNSNTQWLLKGVGPLRVLRHKVRDVSRLLMRGDPSGKIILNKVILGNINYENTERKVKLLTASDTGKGLDTWILQVKTEELAKNLASTLEEQKLKPETST